VSGQRRGQTGYRGGHGSLLQTHTGIRTRYTNPELEFIDDLSQPLGIAATGQA
jgi:hypothetical protein